MLWYVTHVESERERQGWILSTTSKETYRGGRRAQMYVFHVIQTGFRSEFRTNNQNIAKKNALFPSQTLRSSYHKYT